MINQKNHLQGACREFRELQNPLLQNFFRVAKSSFFGQNVTEKLFLRISMRVFANLIWFEQILALPLLTQIKGVYEACFVQVASKWLRTIARNCDLNLVKNDQIFIFRQYLTIPYIFGPPLVIQVEGTLLTCYV